MVTSTSGARARTPSLSAILESGRDRSLAGRLRRTFVLIGALVSVGFFATLIAFAVSEAWLIPEANQCRSAKEAASNLNAAAIDEETGVRGYLLTHDVKFLEPYYRGRTALADANEALDRYAAPVPAFAAGLVRTRIAEQEWNRQWAAPIVEAAANPHVTSLQEGKALFDIYRTEQTAFANAIADRTEVLMRREQMAIGGRVALELAIFMALVILAFRQYRALHEAIVAPVAALLQDIGRVRDGHLITTINQAGPSELRQLGEGLNDMVRALAIAKGDAESRDELVRAHSNRLRQILDASREFSESLNLSYVVRSVRSSTMSVGGYADVIVWLMSDNQDGLRDSALPNDAPLTQDNTEPSVAWRAAKSGRITFEASDGRVRFGDTGSETVRAIAIPLIVGARVVGALEARVSDPRAVDGAALEVLEMLAVHAATAIESARLNQIAEERSHVDPLTRLHNRRRLEEDLEAECKRCARYGGPLAFVMLDVDHFKAFNDTHGHPQADVALQEIAEVIEGVVRATDSAYRYGGEEFCILLRETDGASAMHFAERLRQRLEMRCANGTTTGITASFGVAQFGPDTRAPRTLVEAADAAMYESKRAGRNRVVLSSMPEPALSAPS
jgi:diguanylate cyclase (GGDEF)-like protein